MNLNYGILRKGMVQKLDDSFERSNAIVSFLANLLPSFPSCMERNRLNRTNTNDRKDGLHKVAHIPQSSERACGMARVEDGWFGASRSS